jgi:hypothetical protein
MPTVESLAILRQAKGKCSRDYTYRPNFVKRALLWLKRNNHLYEVILFEWPDEYDWDDINERGDMRYLPLSDNDISAIDENDDDLANGSENNAATSGKIIDTTVNDQQLHITFFAQYINRWTGIRKGDITRHSEHHEDTVRRNASSASSSEGFAAEQRLRIRQRLHQFRILFFQMLSNTLPIRTRLSKRQEQ